MDSLPAGLADRVSTDTLEALGPLLDSSDVVFTSVGTTLPIMDRTLLVADRRLAPVR